jgi:predicted acylesterase/phospholipase RssA
MLPDTKLQQIANLWPAVRVAVLATDFATGQPALFTNAPEDMGALPARFRAAMLASAAAPLAMPPTPIRLNPSGHAQPYFDGGIDAVAPFQAFFDVAARAPGVELTRLIVFSAYPPFPGKDSTAIQRKRFPNRPAFGDTGSRTDALSSESSITKEIDLAWAAIELRRTGFSEEKVRERTGLQIDTAPDEFILMAPETRLGWDDLKFNKKEMRIMFDLGYKAALRPLLP